MPLMSCRPVGASVLCAALCALLSAACDPPPGPTPTRTSAAAPASSASPNTSAQPDTSVQPSASIAPSGAAATGTASSAANALGASAAPSASAPFDPDALAGMTEPPLFGPDGQFLEQTKDEPSTESAVFKERLENLFRAIQHNDPEMARSFFFPVQAYEKVKAIDKAAADWRWRLFGRFKRDIKKYHKRLGKDASEAKLLRIELRRKPEWMKPGREGNRIGYYRVTRSWLHYQAADGKEKHFEITSMISWRGEWYVVHLHGFK